ncbi:MAG: methyltransferase domain-containing protein [Acidobacteriaceae bacterium]|nr:methyltransferase domain-containing protein [Acidobacteriaceae bacterium]
MKILTKFGTGQVSAMPIWSPEQYLTFAEWRTRPSRDLAQRVEVAQPHRIIDLGCGPGNSLEVCAECWPQASLLGLDSSAAMIKTAQTAYPHREWRVADISDWVQQSDGERFDIIFSSAALQWLDNHEALFPRLLDHLTPGGALAVQMPAYEAVPNRVMRELAQSNQWRRWFPEGRAKEWRSHELEFYYEALAPHASRLDLWATDYLQIMPDLGAIVEWYRGTGLRPYLEAITEESDRKRFLAEYAERLQPFYPESAVGGVLFPFRRLFIIAYLG